jgi:outer membrane protein OmpA-like peptidoglycan-associated protein
MTMSRTLSILVVIGLAASMRVTAAPQASPDSDAKGCTDHPLLTRMADMHIVSCRTVEFDRFAFRTGKGVETPVEGRRYEVRYRIATGRPAPGPIAILRNHQQAVARIGGTTKYEDARYTTLQVTHQQQEIWTQVDTAWGGGYMLTIIEKQAMTQQVVANAEAFKAGLAATGHVEVPGIFFDTGQSVLKPESAAAVAEVAALLKASPTLEVYVVGHTDNVAALDLNTRLSQARADAVVQALVRTHGIAAARLVARGVGPLAPVASNDAEDGRARNRRVELVKQ